MTWYALTTVPQKEFLAEAILRQRGFDTFLPVHKKWRRPNKFIRERRLISYPLMRGYIFVREPLWVELFRLRIVTGVVGIEGEPMPISDGSMAHFFKAEFMPRPEEKYMKPHKEFKVGDMAEISAGPLAGRILHISDIHGKSARAVLDLLGKDTPIEIDLENLEAAD